MIDDRTPAAGEPPISPTVGRQNETSHVAGGQPPFDFRPVTRVVFGRGTIGRLGALAAEVARHDGAAAGRARVLVVSDRGIVAAGHAERGIESLRATGLDVFLFDGVAENPTTRHVADGVEFARRHDVNFIVGLGGGSSMDCAKGVNFILTNGGRMSDYWGVGKATRPMLPLIAVPTTAGTGSEAQSFALIADEETHQKMACGDRKAAARVAILDPDLTLTQPRSVTVATGLDAMTHAIESYVCKAANTVARMFAGEAWRMLSGAFENVLREARDIESRGEMLLGANLAGAAIENSMLGAAHACANPLTAMSGVTHGLAVAVMLPHVIRFNGADAGAAAGYRELAVQRLPSPGGGPDEGPKQPTEALAERLAALLDAAGVPRRLRDLGVRADAISSLAALAARQWTAGFNPRRVEMDDLQRLYEAAW